jgi:hypothetical protein
MDKKITSSNYVKTLILISFVLSQLCSKAQSIPLLNGFAHNDYRHKHPLFDALANGYTNIEADIYLRGDSNLVVAHVLPYFKRRRTLEKLYFKPLFDRVTRNGGKVYADYNKPITLMIDVKSGAIDTYRVLQPLLEKYKSMLTSYEDGKIVYRAVTVVISGHKPYGQIETEANRYAFIDEDLRKVARDSSYANVFSMASCKYSSLIKWDGRGDMPASQKEKLCAFVTLAHERGTRVRLWASPERKTVWDTLLKCGVDLINTDKLVTLKNYLHTEKVTLAQAN